MAIDLKSYNEYTITAGGGTIEVSPGDSGKYYIFSGTATLTNNWVVQYDPLYHISETKGMWLELIWQADVDLNGRSITILGNTLTQEQASATGRALFEYDGSNWQMYWNNNQASTVETFTVTSSITDTVDPDVDRTFIVLDGNVTLTGDYTLATGGTPSAGDRFKAFVDATVTLDGNVLTIFGTAIDELTAASGGYVVDTIYDGSSWVTTVSGKTQKEYQDIPSTSQVSTNTVATINSFIEVDASSASITITLPTAVGNAGKLVTITKTDSTANLVKIDGNGSETINGDLSFNLEVELEAITVISNGTNWRII